MEYSATHGFYRLMKVKFSRSTLVFLNERYLIFLKANLLMIICKAKKTNDIFIKSDSFEN